MVVRKAIHVWTTKQADSHSRHGTAQEPALDKVTAVDFCQLLVLPAVHQFSKYVASCDGQVGPEQLW